MASTTGDRLAATDAADAFFRRCRLPPDSRQRCHEFVSRRFPPAARVQPVDAQGYCSYTLSVGADTIVQFRPAAHRLSLELARRAGLVYGSMAPQTKFLGSLQADDDGTDGRTSGRPRLYVYSLSRTPGTSLAEARRATSGSRSRAQNETLVRDFARFLAQGWRRALQPADPALARLKGRVASSLRWRLEQMHGSLPRRFRPAIASVLASLDDIEALPWALTHGDVVPSNVMVEPDSLSLSGLVDWAEAEYLPFGVALYGVEQLMGESTSSGESQPGGRYPPPGSQFRYYPEAAWLRLWFWEELVASVPVLRADETLRRTVESARLLGVLLWHGMAFDDGRLDRVVEEGVDDEDIQRLDLFILGRGGDRTPVLPSRPSVFWTALGTAWSYVHSLCCRICGH